MHAIEREIIKITKYKVQRKFDDRQDYLRSVLLSVQNLDDNKFDELSDEAAKWANACVEIENGKRGADLPDFDEVEDEPEPDEVAENDFTEGDPDDDDGDGSSENEDESDESDDEESEDEGNETSEDETSDLDDETEDSEDELDNDPDDDPDDDETEAESDEDEDLEAEDAASAPEDGPDVDDDDEDLDEGPAPKSPKKAAAGKAPKKKSAAKKAKAPKIPPKEEKIPDPPRRPRPQPDNDIELDKWGCMIGSKNSKALALFEQGATSGEIKRELGGTYYNVLKKMIEQGHRLEKYGAITKLIHRDELAPKKAKKK